MAVPVLFKPVWSNGRPLIDGAVGDVAGVDGLERSERVLYHHVSCHAAAVGQVFSKHKLPIYLFNTDCDARLEWPTGHGNDAPAM